MTSLLTADFTQPESANQFAPESLKAIIPGQHVSPFWDVNKR